jgi:hypothetical protein
VGRSWKALGLKPHQVDTFKPAISAVLDKVRDVVGLYLDPREKAPVLWVDESQIQVSAGDISATDWTKTGTRTQNRSPGTNRRRHRSNGRSYLHRIPGAGH